MSGEINRRLQELKVDLSDRKMAKTAFDFFLRTTPIKSGFARDNTYVKDNIIYANYPYAQRLDEGYSRQAHKGMTEPTIEHVKKYIKRQEK